MSPRIQSSFVAFISMFQSTCILNLLNMRKSCSTFLKTKFSDLLVSALTFKPPCTWMDLHLGFWHIFHWHGNIFLTKYVLLECLKLTLGYLGDRREEISTKFFWTRTRTCCVWFSLVFIRTMSILMFESSAYQFLKCL